MENKDEIKLIISELLDAKLTPISKDIDNIKVNLNNHVAHLTDKLNTMSVNYMGVTNDVSWLKKFFDPEKNVKSDVQSSSDIAWLKWAVRLIIGGVVVEALGILIHIFLN
jgi:hypothetical protein